MSYHGLLAVLRMLTQLGHNPDRTPLKPSGWHNIYDMMHPIANADWPGDSDISISDGADGRHPSYHCCHWRGIAQLLHTVAAHCALLRAQEIHGKCSLVNGHAGTLASSLASHQP